MNSQQLWRMLFQSFLCLLEEIIVVNMEPETAFKKMDTVVKLDSVSSIFYFM